MNSAPSTKAVLREWAPKLAAYLKKNRGRAVKLKDELGVDKSTISKLSKGSGSLELAFAVAEKLGLEPPVEALGEPYRSIMRAATDAIASGIHAATLVGLIHASTVQTKPAEGGAPIIPIRKTGRR